MSVVKFIQTITHLYRGSLESRGCKRLGEVGGVQHCGIPIHTISLSFFFTTNSFTPRNTTLIHVAVLAYIKLYNLLTYTFINCNFANSWIYNNMFLKLMIISFDYVSFLFTKFAFLRNRSMKV